MNQRPSVLVIGMADSIHLARWLTQFADTDIDFYIFPSKKYKYKNEELTKLIHSPRSAKYILIATLNIGFITGYVDFIKFELLAKIFYRLKRSNKLIEIIKKSNFTYIHALEFQGAGYLLNTVPKLLLDKSKTILTNWGSDIFYFRKMPHHATQIRKSLALADYYSAECERDYDLAREFGFIGRALPCIPNAGGFDLEKYRTNAIPPSQRNQLIIKGYGGAFGRADIPINLLVQIEEEFPSINFFVYSLSKDMFQLIKTLPPRVRRKIRISKIRNKISHSQMINEFLRSRVYVGCSETDGISTSYLEALATGAYPIQTSTSCASEWVGRGAASSIISLDSKVALESIREALRSNSLVDSACETNLRVAQKYLEYNSVKEKAFEFYRI